MRLGGLTGEKLLEGVWWLVIGLHLWAIWGVPVFVTQDGPSHLYSVSVFLQLLGENAPVLSQVFEINLRLVPNWMGSGLLLGLSTILGFDNGEKALVTVYVVGLALGFRVVLRSMDLRNGWGKYLVLPLLFNHYLLFGLYNYLLGIVGSLFLFAFGLKHLGSLDARRALILGGGFLAVYFTHLLPAALCGLALVVLLVLRLATSRRRPAVWIREVSFLAAAGAPAAILFFRFLASESRDQGLVWGRPLSSLLRESLTASFLVPFQGGPLVWTSLCLVSVVVVSAWVLIRKVRGRRWGFEDGFLLLGAGVFILQLICPEGLQGGTLTSYRLGIFLWMAVLGWILHQEKALRRVPFSWVLGAVFLVAGISQPFYWAQHLRHFQPVVEDLTGIVSHVPAHSEVWPIVLDPMGRGPSARGFSLRSELFSHVALRSLAAQRDLASRISFQGEVPLFPVRFRDSALVEYFGPGYESRPGEFPILEEAAGFWTDRHPAFLLVIGGSPLDLPSDSPLAILMRDHASPVASIQGDLGPILLFRLEKPEAQPLGD